MQPLWPAVLLGFCCGVTLSCSSASVFACAGDDECTLAQTPGVCQDNGHCAYPDESCESGYAYPAGAGPDLAGTCAPRGTSTSDTGHGDDGETAPDDDDDDGDENPTPDDDDDDDATGDTAGGDDDDDDDATSMGDATMGAIDSDGGASSGGEACVDLVGNSPDRATTLVSCTTQTNSAIIDIADVDWYLLRDDDEDCVPGEYTTTVASSEPVVVCHYARCNGSEPVVTCAEGGSLSLLGELVGCCGGPEASAEFSCGNSGRFESLVVVSAGAGEDICREYELVVAIVPPE